MSEQYDPKAARAKYAVPVWADALLRKTLDMEPQEFGMWHFLIYAMWSRRSLDLPDDDRKLARICRVTVRTWRAKYRESMAEYFEVDGGFWTNDRLTKEAAKTERFLMSQHLRRTGGAEEVIENSDNLCNVNDAIFSALNSGKPLKTINAGSTTVSTTVEPVIDPRCDHTKIPRDYNTDDDDARTQFGSGLQSPIAQLLAKNPSTTHISGIAVHNAVSRWERMGYPADAVEKAITSALDRITGKRINSMAYFEPNLLEGAKPKLTVVPKATGAKAGKKPARLAPVRAAFLGDD